MTSCRSPSPVRSARRPSAYGALLEPRRRGAVLPCRSCLVPGAARVRGAPPRNGLAARRRRGGAPHSARGGRDARRRGAVGCPVDLPIRRLPRAGLPRGPGPGEENAVMFLGAAIVVALELFSTVTEAAYLVVPSLEAAVLAPMIVASTRADGGVMHAALNSRVAAGWAFCRIHSTCGTRCSSPASWVPGSSPPPVGLACLVRGRLRGRERLARVDWATLPAPQGNLAAGPPAQLILSVRCQCTKCVPSRTSRSFTATIDVPSFTDRFQAGLVVRPAPVSPEGIGSRSS